MTDFEDKKKAFARRALGQAYGNVREQDARVSENAGRMKDRLQARSSKKTYAAPRRDLLADRDLFLEMQGSLADGFTVRMTGRSGGPVIRRRYPIHGNPFTRTIEWKEIDDEDRRRRQTGVKEKVFHTPHWDHTGDRMKLLAWTCYAQACEGRFMTVHLSEAARGKISEGGFAKWLRDRMQRSLRRGFDRLGLTPPEFFFVLEASLGIEPHLHGGIILPDHPKAESAAKVALKEAVGEWRDSARQTRFQQMATPVRLANYVGKWTRVTMSELKIDSVTAATNGLRAGAKDWYVAARAVEAPLG